MEDVRRIYFLRSCGEYQLSQSICFDMQFDKQKQKKNIFLGSQQFIIRNLNLTISTITFFSSIYCIIKENYRLNGSWKFGLADIPLQTIQTYT